MTIDRDTGRRFVGNAPRRRILLLVGLVSCIVSTSGGGAMGFSWFILEGKVVVWPDATDTRWLSGATFPKGSAIETAVLGAAGAWNVSGGSSWQYTAGRDDIDPPDQLDGISFTAAVPGTYFDDPNTLAATLLGHIGPAWADMDTLFNANAPNDWLWSTDTAPGCGVLTEPETYGVVFMSVAMHEFGHAFGLGHEERVLATMNAFYPNGGTFGQENVIEPHADDRAGQRFLYPGGEFTDLGNGNFYQRDDGSVERNAFSPTIVNPGDEFTLDIQVVNLGTTAVQDVRYGFYLSTDEIIETSDTLIGTVTWTTIEAMAAGHFDVTIELPNTVASGTFHVGTVFDDTHVVDEAWEDNNAVVYCDTLTINTVAPQIVSKADEPAPCGHAFTSTAPELTQPLNMNPVTWTLVQGPDTMTIDGKSGAVTWPTPDALGSPHTVTIRASNAVGSDEQSFQLLVAAGDLNGSMDVDIFDLPLFNACYTGPDGGVGLDCSCADLDHDADVDLIDFGAFQIAVE